jgi:hypothetical protein
MRYNLFIHWLSSFGSWRRVGDTTAALFVGRAKQLLLTDNILADIAMNVKRQKQIDCDD